MLYVVLLARVLVYLYLSFSSLRKDNSTQQGEIINMMDANGYYDSPNQSSTYNDQNNLLDDNIKLSIFSLEDLPSNHNDLSSEVAVAAAIDLDVHLQHPVSFDFEQELQSHMIQDAAPPIESTEWETSPLQHIHEAEENLIRHYYAAAPDLLNILQLPRCSVPPPPPPPPLLPTNMASISFNNTPSLQPAPFSFDHIYNEVPAMQNTGSSMMYESTQQLAYPAQSHLLKDLFSSLPQNYGLFCGADEREAVAGGGGDMGGGNVFHEIGLDYRREMGGLGKGEGKTNFATERQRREQLNEKYKALRLLIPNPTKADRASIVGDAIEYIKELLRTVEELKMLAETKRQGTERSEMLKMEDDMESSSIRPPLNGDCDRQLSGALRSSWLQRRSKESTVDVRIVDDEVNIKLTQKKKANCLLFAAKVLEELQLELIHVAGGSIGDHYVFMFNTKISQGSTVFAGAIAKKLLEAADTQYICSFSLPLQIKGNI